MSDVQRICMVQNPLHIDEFYFSGQLDAEIVKITVDLYKGDKECCGTTTSGGTESLLLAVLTYRNWGKEIKGITNPNIVIPETAHPGFAKACHMFNIELIRVPSITTGRINVAGMRRKINKNTVMICGSAPDFPYGNYDPFEELSDIALEKGIGLHIDACMGSYINPFIREAGFEPSQVCDFTIPGATSISCDVHKFG